MEIVHKNEGLSVKEENRKLPKCTLEILLYAREDKKELLSENFLKSLEKQLNQTDKGKYTRVFWYIDSNTSGKSEEEIIKILHDNTNAQFKVVLSVEKDSIADDFIEQCFKKIDNYWNSIKELKEIGITKH